jgi:hypothetical protein
MYVYRLVPQYSYLLSPCSCSSPARSWSALVWGKKVGKVSSLLNLLHLKNKKRVVQRISALDQVQIDGSDLCNIAHVLFLPVV